MTQNNERTNSTEIRTNEPKGEWMVGHGQISSQPNFLKYLY